MAFSRNGLDLATADAEGIIKTWGDVRKLTSNSEAHRTLKGHAAEITKVAFSTTGKQLVSGSRDGTVRLWELEQSQSAPRRLQASSAAPVFFAGGRLIATAEGNRVTIWDAASGQRLRSLADGDTIVSVAISPDNRLLAVGRYAGTGPPPPYRPYYLSIWEMNTGRRLAEFFDHNSDQFFAYCALETLAFSPDGKFLVAGLGSRSSHYSSRSTDLRVWEVATFREHKRLARARQCVRVDQLLCRRDEDGQRQSRRHGQDLGHCDLASGRRAPHGAWTRGCPPSGYFRRPRFRRSRGLFAGWWHARHGDLSGSILLWNARSGDRAALPKAHANSVVCIAFSPDGRTLASGSEDETIRLWNVATRRELMVLNSKDLRLGSAGSLSFSPDGTQLLANCSPTGVVVWSAAPSVWDNPSLAGKELRPLLASPADFQSHVRMWSDIPRLLEALETLDANDRQVQAALAATRQPARPSPAVGRRRQGVRSLARTWSRRASGLAPYPGLIRLATAYLHEGARPRQPPCWREARTAQPGRAPSRH